MTGLTVLHLLPWLNFGGVEKYVIGLSVALRERGHRCIIASSGGALLAEAEAAGVEHVPIDLRGVGGMTAALRLARIIDDEEVDLLNAHNWTAGAIGFLGARLARIPYVFTVHGIRSPLQRFFTYYWSRKVVAVSDASRDHLIHCYHLDPARVVKSVIGVDTDTFEPRPPAAALLRELGLDPDAPRIVHVSRFSRGKAEVALRLIDAAPAIEQRAPGFQAIIAGVGPLERRVAARSDEANRALGRRAFVFAGGRADVADLMSLADVAIGTATVALEAMSCGKPVVAAGKCGFIGLVTDETLDEAEATCFGDHAAPAPVTAAKLARAIGEVLPRSQRSGELARFSRQTVLRSYSRRRAAESIERIYHDVLVGSEPLRRIAVFHLNQIGDLLFSLPALAALRQRFPHAEITSILRPYLVELIEAGPYVDRIITRVGGAMAEARLAREIRRRGFDLMVALSQSLATGLQVLGCGAPERVGFVDTDLGCFLTRKVHMRGLPWPGKLGRMAICLGAEAPRDSYVGMLRIREEVRARAQQLLARVGIAPGQRIALIAPGASGRRRYKAWDASRFAEAADYLRERWQAAVVIVGGDADAIETARVASTMSQAALGAAPERGKPRAACINLAGQTTTGELAVIAERADILVGLDSGPMHVAAAMGTPTVALFGPTDPRRTGPHGEGHEVVTAGLKCSPCARPCETRECMSAITVEQVTAAVDRVLGRAERIRTPLPSRERLGEGGLSSP